MKTNFIDLLDDFEDLGPNETLLRLVSIENVSYFKVDKKVEIKVHSKYVFPSLLYVQISNFLSAKFSAKVQLIIDAEDSTINYADYMSYFHMFFKELQLSEIFEECSPKLERGEVTLCFNSQEQLVKAERYYDQLTAYMESLGMKFTYRSTIFDKKEVIAPEVKIEIAPKKDLPFAQNTPKEKKPFNKKKSERYTLVKIKDLKEAVSDVKFIGCVFNVDNRMTRIGKYIQQLSIVDSESAVKAKRFESRSQTKEVIEAVEKNSHWTFFGSYVFDSFANDYVFQLDSMEPLMVDIVKIVDEAPVKRIEFHMHSNRSEMDAVCDVEDLVKHAYHLGHKAVALTDHMVVQGFPKAQRTIDALNKKNQTDFKMIYGVEMNLTNRFFDIVTHPTPLALSDMDYIVFDIETTGLSNHEDYIIEFAASLVHHDTVVETIDLLIKPPIPIPAFITSLTHIDDKMVEHEPTLDQSIDQILAFIKDYPLVAHNGLFDYDFMNAELIRLNRPKLTNPLIDTLALARLSIQGRKSYRLGSLANFYKIEYRDTDAHRADYDVNILVEVFKRLKGTALERGVKTLEELQTNQSEDAFMRLMKRHVCVLAKNQTGLKDLFKLITISNTETLALLGKANSKANGEEYLAEPRVIRDTLNNCRQNLLIGSACFNGELFELAVNKSKEALKEAMSFYDYIEIQPLENYRPLIESRSVPSVERLKRALKRMIEVAKELDILVIATGDVHYVLKEDKVYRDIYINSQGIGGVHHPLYIYDQTRRLNTINPDQHFRTTEEMLTAFSWLEDQRLIQGLVVENPSKLNDQIEIMRPLHDDLKTPKIEGAAEKLTAVCYETAHKKYGSPLPEIVKKRLQRELDSIIGNGYEVVYYVSHLLVKRSNEEGYLVGSRGSVGSSFAATMSGITEVNPLMPHYICNQCQYSEWINDGSVISGYDLMDKVCPTCGAQLQGDGQDIPFETFLGFEGDKVPDIDLNFSGDYQERAHQFTKEVFGEAFVYRAGTIGTVANKTAFGYIKGYCDAMNIDSMSSAYREYLASKCEGVKRTTGQHPGGIIVIPNDMDVYDFTPVQYPANNPESSWKTTHFDFHDIHDNVLKFDILGHVDPTVMRLLFNISGIDPTSIPMNDPKAMSVFASIKALNVDERTYNEVTGAVGLPEFGTRFVRGILELTRPKCFSELVSISGLSHGTDVWNNNAKDLIESGHSLKEVIGCRDDIMTELIQYGLDPKTAFTIMESVRKGKGLKEEWIKIMQKNNVPEWYIESCQKIKYMFPKAHAVAYVIMAVRIAWFKVHHPHFYYVAFFSLRCDAYEIETMTKDAFTITKRMGEIQTLNQNRQASNKELKIYETLEVCLEMVSRGYRLNNIDIYRSQATEFCIDEKDPTVIIPPFTILDGLGENVAKSIVEAREVQTFLSKQDLMQRSQLSQTLLKKMELLHVLDDLDESNQMSLF